MKDVSLKVKFLDQECENPKGLVQLNPNNNSYVMNMDIFPEENHALSFTSIINNERLIIISDFYFKKIKAKFNTFKKNQKDINLIRKQYLLNKNTAQKIKSVQESKKLSREEHAIDYIVDQYINSMLTQKTTEKINAKKIKLDIYQNEIKIISQFNHDLNQIKQRLTSENYSLIRSLAISNIKNLEYKITLDEANINKSILTPTETEIQKEILSIKENLY